MKRSKLKWFVGGTVIATSVLLIATLNLGSNLVYFYTPSEAYAQGTELDGQNVKLAGMVKGGSVDWQPRDLSLRFVVTDFKGHEIRVAHKGTPPDMFKENQGVVVEGRLTDVGRSIVSKNLMVKHSEEYRPPNMTGPMDKELLERSLFNK